MAKQPAKRGYGTGSLQQIGKVWYGLWRDESGTRVKSRIGPIKSPVHPEGLNRKEAEAAFAKIRSAERPPSANTTARVTVAVAGEALKSSLEIRGRRKSHKLTVASDLRNHLAPFFDEQTLAEITPDDIERYIRVKRKTLAIKTIRNHVNTLHSIFEIGVRKGWCPTNPVKIAERPQIKKSQTRIRFLDQPQLEQLIAGTYPDDVFGTIEPTLYLTAAMTGLRQGELLGLRWRDVDFAARRIRVVSPYVRGEFDETKSTESSRSVPMASQVSDALTSLRDQSAYSSAGALTFCHPETGHPLDRSKLTRRFAKALEENGLPKVTFHELRHTFGTRMAAAGVPIRTIQQWMGHADMKTTQIYAHYSPTDHEADTIDAAFS